jgi:hypothetical protein
MAVDVNHLQAELFADEPQDPSKATRWCATRMREIDDEARDIASREPIVLSEDEAKRWESARCHLLDVLAWQRFALSRRHHELLMAIEHDFELANHPQPRTAPDETTQLAIGVVRKLARSTARRPSPMLGSSVRVRRPLARPRQRRSRHRRAGTRSSAASGDSSGEPEPGEPAQDDIGRALGWIGRAVRRWWA